MSFIKIFSLLSILTFSSSKFNENEILSKNWIKELGNEVNKNGTHLFALKLESLNPNEFLHFYVDFFEKNETLNSEEENFKYYFINEDIKNISNYGPNNITKNIITNITTIQDKDEQLNKYYFDIQIEPEQKVLLLEINFITPGWIVNTKYDESKSISLSTQNITIQFEGIPIFIKAQISSIVQYQYYETHFESNTNFLENADIKYQSYTSIDTFRTFHQLMYNSSKQLNPYQIKLNDNYSYFDQKVKYNDRYVLYCFNTNKTGEIIFYIENQNTYEESSFSSYSNVTFNFSMTILYSIYHFSDPNEDKNYFVLRKPSTLNNLPKMYYSLKKENDHLLELKELDYKKKETTEIHYLYFQISGLVGSIVFINEDKINEGQFDFRPSKVYEYEYIKIPLYTSSSEIILSTDKKINTFAIGNLDENEYFNVKFKLKNTKNNNNINITIKVELRDEDYNELYEIPEADNSFHEIHFKFDNYIYIFFNQKNIIQDIIYKDELMLKSIFYDNNIIEGKNKSIYFSINNNGEEDVSIIVESTETDESQIESSLFEPYKNKTFNIKEKTTALFYFNTSTLEEKNILYFEFYSLKSSFNSEKVFIYQNKSNIDENNFDFKILTTCKNVENNTNLTIYCNVSNTNEEDLIIFGIELNKNTNITVGHYENSRYIPPVQPSDQPSSDQPSGGQNSFLLFLIIGIIFILIIGILIFSIVLKSKQVDSTTVEKIEGL